MIPDGLSRLVRERAGGRCHYCRTSQGLQAALFHVGHVVPSSQGGPAALANVCLICPSCIWGKGDATKAVDPPSGSLFPLFNPRVDRWQDHFSVNGVEIVGRTGTGRATVTQLDMNSEPRLRIRALEQDLGWWPPPAR